MSELLITLDVPPIEIDPLTLRDLILKAIAKPLTKIVKEETEVLADCDPEPLHQMRVGTRRLRTAFGLFRPYLVLKKRVYREVAQLAAQLGAVRDLDVLGLSLQQSQQQLTFDLQEQAQIYLLLEHLNRLRRKRFKKLSTLLRSDRYLQLMRHLEQWVHHPQVEVGAQWSAAIALPDLLMPSVHEWLRHPGWLVETLTVPAESNPLEIQKTATQDSDRLLHDLRKLTKRLRYQIESFTDFYGAEVAQYLTELKQIQELLGAQQDSAVLAAFYTTVLGKAWAHRIPCLATALHHTRQSLEQQWQPLRQTFLQIETRQRVRSLLACPEFESRQSKARAQTHPTP